MAADERAEPPLTIGFACHWQHDRPMTWSGTPWALRAALREEAELVDIEVGAPKALEKTLRVAGVRRHEGRWRSDWRRGRVPRAVARTRLARTTTADLDAVVQLQDLGITRAPSYVVQDASFRLLQEEYGPRGVPTYETLSRRRVDALQREQERVYEHATGLFPMSRWLARSLERNGIAPERITVVHPGMNVPVDPSEQPLPRREGRVRKLLFVGRDWPRKCGTQVVEAFAVLRREFGPEISLTIAGPPAWPLRTGPGPGIDFLGEVPSSRVRELMWSHDLFVMPSVSEGFGIVFAEALARGLPCVGRNACAMPEIIRPGENGNLVDSMDPADLAAVIVDTLRDDDVYVRCEQNMRSTRRYFSWQRASAQMVSAIRSPPNEGIR